jgi:CBS domain-containing protein
MEIELIEIRDFIAHHTPFGLLPPELLDPLPKSLTVRYLRRDSVFPPPQHEAPQLIIIRSGAVEVRDAQGRLDEKLGEGGLFIDACRHEAHDAPRNGMTVEDTLLYLLPCAKLTELRRLAPIFDVHFSESLRQRMRHAINSVRESGSDISAFTTHVGELLRRPPVTIAIDANIQEAAQLMVRHNVSSVMVVDGTHLSGMITDSDLRRRCVAEGLSIYTPVHAIMSNNMCTVQHDELLATALMTMTRLHVHHLPVLHNDIPVGMLTVTDLVRHQSTNSAFIASDIRKAKDVADLVRAAARLPDVQVQMANSGATAAHVGEAVSHITDALTRRLLEMAEAQLGTAPVPYVWLTGGSQARREQTSSSDQDNALLLADEVKDNDDDYFSALARFVCDGLNACGFVYCPGDAMAMTPTWRQPLRVWRTYFNNWIQRPQPKALMLASIFFDLRPVHGAGELFTQLHGDVLEQSKKNRIFIAHMVANALSHRPPLGFFRDFALIHGGAHDDTFDIKHRGIVPITDIARVYALSEGLIAVNSNERLHAAAQSGALSSEMNDNLRDALELIAGMRIRHQTRQIRAGETPDNYLPPAHLSELERKHLKDAFKVIQTMQNTLENRYQAGRLV